MADTLRSRLFRVLAAAAAVACLPLILSSSSVEASSTSSPLRQRGARRRGLRQRQSRSGRHQKGPPHLALLDASDFEHLLGEDAAWAADNIPFLDFDESVEGGASLMRAFYFRWRVFRRHLKRTEESGGGDDGSAAVQCCAGAASECALVGPTTGWCSGAKSEDSCHRRRTEGRPCVWREGRCAKGHPFGAGMQPACPRARSEGGALRPGGSAEGAPAPISWIVTEFEPSVPWAGAHNTIACSAGHHLMEGRWLRNATFLDDYSRFWLEEPAPSLTPPPAARAAVARARGYTFWAASAMYSRFLVTGDMGLLRLLYAPLRSNYRAWVDTHYSREHGCFWQYADRDGQEHSIGGDGCRPLLNAVMSGEAASLAAMAALLGDSAGGSRFQADASRWRASLLRLWSPARQFFVTRAIRRPETAPRHRWAEEEWTNARALNGGRCPPEWADGELVSSRELQGLSSPWYFRAVPARSAARYAAAFGRLFDRTGGFGAEWGPRTAERSDACYNYTSHHECTWNAPSWPFETSKVITGALNFLHDYPAAAHAAPGAIDAHGLWRLLRDYARAHTHARAVNSSGWLLSGLGGAWIGEALHPDEGYWLPRARLYAAGSPHRNRGHRYLHSTFCDLVIGALGVRPSPPPAAAEVEDALMMGADAPARVPGGGASGGGAAGGGAAGGGASGASAGPSSLLVINPLLPAPALGVRYFAIDGLRIRGRDVCVAYDMDGSRYGLGAGLHVLVDGIKAKSGPLGTPLRVELV